MKGKYSHPDDQDSEINVSYFNEKKLMCLGKKINGYLTNLIIKLLLLLSLLLLLLLLLLLIFRVDDRCFCYGYVLLISEGILF